jgi:hypothetical protein
MMAFYFSFYHRDPFLCFSTPPFPSLLVILHRSFSVGVHQSSDQSMLRTSFDDPNRGHSLVIYLHLSVEVFAQIMVS